MKLHRLEISGFRGIAAPIEFSPGGESVIFHGPNGSGKSSIIDAVDFLLTGKIRRLSGTGMQRVTLARHGRHVHTDQGGAYVEADVSLHGDEAPVTIRRTLGDPNTLGVEENARGGMTLVEDAARRGLHVLTRRDILAFIAIEPSGRLAQVERLLKLDGIGQTRRALVQADNQAKRLVDEARKGHADAMRAVAGQIGIGHYDQGLVLDQANTWRKVLGGDPMPKLSGQDLKKGLRHAPQEEQGRAVNPAAITRLRYALVSVVDAVAEEVEGPLESLRIALSDLRRSRVALRALEVDLLVEKGLDLLDGSGSCPLCDTEWDPIELKEHLENKHERAAEYARLRSDVESHARVLRDALNRALQSSRDLLAPLKGLVELPVDGLQEQHDAVQRLILRLQTPLELTYQDTLLQGNGTLTPVLDGLVREADACLEFVQRRYPAPGAVQDAWDELTKLQVGLDRAVQAHGKVERARQVSARTTAGLQAFQEARDAVLSRIYADVRRRFQDYYRDLHGPDEADFEATLTPREGALDLEVGFYDQGQHSPLAFHSEGHQDSMGICLFFALGEYLGTGALDVFLLDDVVMSVDSGHRRRLAELLQREFKGRQFIVTTHDGTWARQLRSAGVVRRRSALVELFNWDVRTGPSIAAGGDTFRMIEQRMKSNNVPAAAHLLRRESEAFFRGVAEALGAKVVYRSDNRWELQDFLSGVISAYTSQLKRAIKHARKYGASHGEVAALEERQAQFQQILARTQAEQWAVNENVHYNNWTEFSEGDFRRVVEAFADLHAVFSCPKCGSEIRLVETARASIVTCSCGAETMHLEPG